MGQFVIAALRPKNNRPISPDNVYLPDNSGDYSPQARFWLLGENPYKPTSGTLGSS
jgi:hypothetical protein